jgi:hypothetical protein
MPAGERDPDALHRLCVGTADCRFSPRDERAREGKSAFSKRPSLAVKGVHGEPIYRRSAGLDVHKKAISVCARVRVGSHQPTMESATFGTFTCDWKAMGDWLKARKVGHVAMESTGVYWKPVWNVLESSRWKFDLLLVNPQLVRALPGKKTDREDSERHFPRRG